MKKRVVISKSALVGMLILGTTFPSTWPIAQATETQQTEQQTPSIDSSVPLLADSTGSMDSGEKTDSQEGNADVVSSETTASEVVTTPSNPETNQSNASDTAEKTQISVTAPSAETIVESTDSQPFAAESTKSIESFNYDLTVEYDPIKYKALVLDLPIPEKYAHQTLYQDPQLTEDFYVYKTDKVYMLVGLWYTSEVTGTNQLNISWTSFTGFTINYYGLTAVLEYTDVNGNLLFTATYNVRFTNSHLTVKYVDESGMEIYPSQTIHNSTNEPYNVSTSAFIPEIPGYVLDTNQLPTNAKGNFPRGEATVTYVYQKAPTDFTALSVKDTTIYEQDTWSAADNFEQAVSKEGKILTYEEFLAEGGSVSGQVDTSQAGTYTISYHLNNVSKEATVLVKPRFTTITVHDSSLYVGENWSPEDNFDQAVDRDNHPVAFADVSVDGSVDTKKAGTYEVVYRYDGIESKAIITVKADQTNVTAHDSELYTGENWTARDNFDSATDRDGKPVEFGDITVTGKADTTKAGEYVVIYSYNGIESKALVTVKADQTTVKVHNSELYTGENWTAKDNFDSATDRDGKPVAFEDITVTGTVDTTQAGKYEVTYSYHGVESKAIITVKADQTTVKVHDSELYTGEQWEAKDNYDSATDRDGSSVDFGDITVTGTVDTTQAGKYEVIYGYHGVESKAIITVKADQTTVKVHDSELYTGEHWEAKDNFDSATDRDGKPVDFGDITVTGKADTTKAGEYVVIYSYHGLKSKATITVKADQTSLKVHDSTIKQGDEWLPETNIDSAMDRDGKEVAFSEVEVNGTVNNNIVGQYTVSYHYGAVIAYAVITVQAKVSEAPNETPEETPTEVPEENRPESESPVTEIPETEASDPIIEEPIKTRPETETSETNNQERNGKRPSEQSDKPSATEQKARIKASKQSTAKQLPKTGETSSVLLSVTGILFLIGGLVFLFRKKSWRKQQ
ncbi:bacterial Ig-like domain-containing protein [Enterococcus casseliflavus]|uniref:bacterial Ig-like domain-containing protein n=2 Tax=Enterococcus TaxID=1350 RepID=UPI001CD38E7C|nr:bacterial Ig-like domain-containing protein [Enterococcus casseliflavus]MDT2955720.1 bacterial Ig-like domain-containing protein [Enterococcus casseliflavus]MDT2958925.1 bacterial Ig-like domain-containing protein [Enterococcus casseliflavus]MDT2990369.1 bacterial Ig-like domain-containing protein [Enterococcus casseliflavus]MDV7690174.1 bacterial Ig-like domain-containing protein [Enterococcus casseliflavus]MDV7737810.1 bacterial Ig-like domain-containing protein [Enterococcus casseliflavu